MIAAGGTAGHVVPALAVADALRERGVAVSFIGGERAEAELVPAAGYPFATIRVAALDRRNPLRALAALTVAARAVITARRQLRREKADVVLAGGGYVAGPVGIAARLLRKPLVVTEADAHLGLTNRLLAPFAARVCLAFPLSRRYGDRYRVTGRPIATRSGVPGRAEARVRFGLPPERRCLLVFGGSLGARTINSAVLGAYGGGAPGDLSILHLTGRNDHKRCETLLDAAGAGAYRLIDYSDDFPSALAAADLAICRAGGSIFELAAAGLPAVLVPYPHASADHQALNARWLVEAGGALMIPDAELTPERVRETVEDLLADPDRLAAMAEAARAVARPDAAAAIADELIAAATAQASSGDGREYTPDQAGPPAQPR